MAHLQVRAALLSLLFVLPGCGGGWFDPPECEWIIPQDLTGRWVSELMDPLVTGSEPDDVEQEIYLLQDDGRMISGSYEEITRDGSSTTWPVAGYFDVASGLLEMSHDSPTYGRLARIFRVTAVDEMWQVVEHDPDRCWFVRYQRD